MRDFKILVLAAAALLLCGAHAQSIPAGQITGHSYRNAALHISYTCPAMLRPSVPAAVTDPAAYEAPLLIARQGDQPYGIVLVAEKRDVAGPHSSSVKSSADLIDRMQQSLRPGPALSHITRSQQKTAGGRVFDELDYLLNGKPASVIATQEGSYLLVFKCNAATAADMASMRNSAYALATTGH